MQRYNPKDIEPKWQKTWNDSGIYKATDFSDKPKYVMLTEFPYPSGAGIHIGHAREYTYGDMIARYKRMQGYNVLYPMGFDEFGLPTENFAIKNKVTPQSATETNVANFQKQLEALGYSFDWSRAVHTSDPNYYKWTQWLFLQFYKAGMAYQAEIAINWCPHCKTGLANEEVVNGRHERCDTIVEKKLLKQWLLKITAYADSLIEGLKTVDYPSRIADQQVNWIGRSTGAEVVFPVDQTDERYISLHCFQGSPEMEFQPWLAKTLRDAGHEVSVPELPNTKKPVVADQVASVLKSEKFDENTVLIGHSLGSTVALKVLEAIDVKIKRLVLVAGFAEPGFNDRKRPFEKTFDWQFDFEKIKANVDEIIILRDTTDPAVPAERADYLQNHLGGTIVDFEAQTPHVCGEIEPVVLEHIRPSLKVFTTRVDTLFGADFLVLAPEHPLVDQITTDEHRAAVNNYRKAAAAKTDIERQSTDKEKTGVATGAHAINPISGKRIPVWIADYVLTGYGTGAIMAVPAHDQRDYAFAKKYNLPITEVVMKHEKYVGKNAPREGVEAIERRTASAIIINQQGQYLLQIEPDNTHFVGGGVDNTDANDIAALKREITEEVGFTDFKSVKQISSTLSVNFYRYTKNKNVTSYGKFFEVVLGSDTQVKSELETDQHNIKWVDKKEVAAQLTWSGHAFAWEQYLGGNLCYNGPGLLINSGQYTGMDSQDAKAKIIADLTAKGMGGEKINYRLRDWVFSRQHYWGEPIPVIHCPEHGAVAVPEDQLPIVLPKVDHYEPTDTGESPLSEIEDWVNTTCPECGGAAKRETDTMPNWAGSSWYYLRYFDAHNDKVFADREKLEYWKDVDLYLGGMEHTTLHLLYSRFWHQFFYEQGLVPTPEPYAARRGQGIIQATDGTKMSKSKGNVVNPTDIIDSGYGADALRMAIAFLAPYDQTTPWSPEAVAGTHRVLQRTWTLLGEYAESDGGTEDSPELERVINKAVKKVTEDLDSLGFNTAIAALMECVNELYAIKKDGFAASEWQWALETLVQLLAPFAPHVTEELWEQLGHTSSVHKTQWPTFDESKLVEDTIKIVIQVNGKVRGDIQVAADAPENEVVSAAKANERVAGYLENKEIRKTIYVPGKLVSFVI